jgi:hypothetical protein
VAERILNAECGHDKYISAVVPVPGALRIIVSAKAGTVKPADEDRAIELVRAHSDMSCNRTVALLKQHGIRRNANWVSQQHYDIEAQRNATQRKRTRGRGQKLTMQAEKVAAIHKYRQTRINLISMVIEQSR